MLKEFKEKVLSTESQFYLYDDRTKILCVKVPVGKAEYIYTLSEYLREDDKDIAININDKLKLTAIYAGEIYLLQPYEVMRSLDEKYPTDMFYLNGEFLETVMAHIKKTVIDPLYEKLDTRELTEDEELKCQEEAKRLIIYNKNIDDYFANIIKSGNEKRTVQNFVNHLCGIIDINEETINKFEEEKEKWIYLKSRIERTRKIVESELELVLKDYEINIIKSLQDVDAKTVNVEFMYNGLKASGKIIPDVIRRIIYDNDYFSDYNFASSKNGEKIINNLGAAKWKGDRGKELLTCEHIVKITYGKKVLYEKL